MTSYWARLEKADRFSYALARECKNLGDSGKAIAVREATEGKLNELTGQSPPFPESETNIATMQLFEGLAKRHGVKLDAKRIAKEIVNERLLLGKLDVKDLRAEELKPPTKR